MALTKVQNQMIQGAPVNVLDYGAVGNGSADGATGTDDLAAIQAAVDSGASHVVLPAGYRFVISNAVSLPADIVFEINGDLVLAANSADGITMITNSDRVAYQNNIHVTGTGKVLGNKANQQTGVEIRHTCINFFKVIACSVSVKEVGGNKWDNLYQSVPANNHACAIQIHDCKYCRVSGVLLYEWEHEGINLDPSGGLCAYNIVEDCICSGSGAESYSGIQMGGIGGSVHNIVSNCIVEDCGASGIGLDGLYSIVSDCTVTRNGYFHGINCGHAGAPGSYSVISNCTVKDAGNLATTQDSNGINIGNGSTNVLISNCNIYGAHDSGINLSVATNCQISNCQINDAGDHGFKLNVADGTKISNCVVINQGLNILSDVGTPSADLWYEINDTVFRRYGAVDGSGTFVPSIIGATGSGTQSIQFGYYDRVGRRVFFNLRVSISSLGTLGGNIGISGLPFTSLATQSSYASITVGNASGMNIAAGQSLTGYVDLNATTISLQLWDATTGSTSLQAGDLTSSSQVWISGSYIA